MAWLEYRLLGIHDCGNRDCYSDECCILGHEAANAKERKIKAGGLFRFWKRPPAFLIWLYPSLLQGAFALALQTFNGKKGFYFTKKSYHKTVSFCHEAEGCGLLYILRRERMIAAVIDIGSNTMRMSVYKIEGQKFTVLLSKKETAGLVNYITEGEMSEEGIGVLIDVLQQFCSSLEEISVNSINAFATASLRNVANSEQVLARIFHAVGLKVELLSGEEEAILSFSGAVHASPFADGCLFDLGGGSTEVVAFRQRKPYYAKSMNIGCLNLYKRYVKKIWPKKLEIEEMKLFIERNLAEAALPEQPQPLLIGVGGTARSLLELINLREKRDASHREITMEELHTCVSFLLKRDTNARDAVLKKCPDRIHTIIPGALLMQALAKKMKAERLYISEYGVREGYLWKEFIKTTI